MSLALAVALSLFVLFFFWALGENRIDTIYRAKCKEIKTYFHHPYWDSHLFTEHDSNFDDYWPTDNYMLFRFWVSPMKKFQLKPYPWEVNDQGGDRART